MPVRDGVPGDNHFENSGLGKGLTYSTTNSLTYFLLEAHLSSSHWRLVVRAAPGFLQFSLPLAASSEDRAFLVIDGLHQSAAASLAKQDRKWIIFWSCVADKRRLVGRSWRSSRFAPK
jgi:hypothetical protein